MYLSFGSGFYSYVWAITGFLTVVVPLVFRTMRVRDFKQLNMMYNWNEYWEEQQQQQEQQYNYNAGNGQNYNYYNGQYYEQMRENYDVNRCRWWQLNCYPYYINGEGEAQVEAGWYPSWFSGWTQTQEEREAMQEAGIVSGPMRFVYVWQILTFLVILAYGFMVLKKDRPLTGLVIALVVFWNMCFVSMWWLADGSIITDSEYVQTTGFYGQFPVLMFITNAAYVLFGLVHTGLLLWYGNAMEQENDNEEVRLSHSSVGGKKISPTENGWTVIE